MIKRRLGEFLDLVGNCTLFFCFVTVLFIKAIKDKKPLGKSLKDWIVNIIDIFSGG